jgi:hypothetical protein
MLNPDKSRTDSGDMRRRINLQKVDNKKVDTVMWGSSKDGGAKQYRRWNGRQQRIIASRCPRARRWTWKLWSRTHTTTSPFHQTNSPYTNFIM